ncbi:hypothetical protein OG873_20005 [Streptomyces violaceus]|nr:hypothetical protein [Streptomyces violaceus]
MARERLIAKGSCRLDPDHYLAWDGGVHAFVLDTVVAPAPL